MGAVVPRRNAGGGAAALAPGKVTRRMPAHLEGWSPNSEVRNCHSQKAPRGLEGSVQVGSWMESWALGMPRADLRAVLIRFMDKQMHDVKVRGGLQRWAPGAPGCPRSGSVTPIAPQGKVYY